MIHVYVCLFLCIYSYICVLQNEQSRLTKGAAGAKPCQAAFSCSALAAARTAPRGHRGRFRSRSILMVGAQRDPSMDAVLQGLQE